MMLKTIVLMVPFAGLAHADVTEDQARLRMDELNRKAASQPVQISIETRLLSENRALKDKIAELEIAAKKAQDELIATQKKLDDLTASIRLVKDSESDPIKAAIARHEIIVGMTLSQVQEATSQPGFRFAQDTTGEDWDFTEVRFRDGTVSISRKCRVEKGKVTSVWVP